jgi:hypothetical protein
MYINITIGYIIFLILSRIMNDGTILTHVDIISALFFGLILSGFKFLFMERTLASGEEQLKCTRIIEAISYPTLSFFVFQASGPYATITGMICAISLTAVTFLSGIIRFDKSSFYGVFFVNMVMYATIAKYLESVLIFLMFIMWFFVCYFYRLKAVDGYDYASGKIIPDSKFEKYILIPLIFVLLVTGFRINSTNGTMTIHFDGFF